MNVHHLELFYYVTRHGGISEAARRMPYGIQQPAISFQIQQLEKALGVALFERRPFALTSAGQALFEFIAPFFSNLESVSEKLQHGAVSSLRLAASSTILKDHLPELLRALRKKYPALKLTLTEASQELVQDLLARQQVDLGISVLEQIPPKEVQMHELLKLPLALVLPDAIKIRNSAEFFKKGHHLAHSLITLSATNSLSRLFQSELQARRIQWPIQVEVDSLDLIHAYVQGGFGVGVAVMAPQYVLPRNVRWLPLQGFARVGIGIFWRGELNPLQADFLEVVKARAKAIAQG